MKAGLLIGLGTIVLLYGQLAMAKTQNDSTEDLFGSAQTEHAATAPNESTESTAPATDRGLAEEAGKPYFSVGLRLRWIMIPEWLVKAFGVDTTHPAGTGSSLPLMSNIGIGPEFTYRKDNFDIIGAIWYANLGWEDPISFKEKNKVGDSWEVVTNDLKAILITFDFLWSKPITDWVAITYGAGLGLGIPWGDIVRTEATAASDGTEACSGPGDPDPWCGADEQYGETWDKLKVIPWINFMLGARFKPHRNVVINVDGGFGIGFQLGLRAGYVF